MRKVHPVTSPPPLPLTRPQRGGEPIPNDRTFHRHWSLRLSWTDLFRCQDSIRICRTVEAKKKLIQYYIYIIYIVRFILNWKMNPEIQIFEKRRICSITREFRWFLHFCFAIRYCKEKTMYNIIWFLATKGDHGWQAMTVAIYFYFWTTFLKWSIKYGVPSKLFQLSLQLVSFWTFLDKYPIRIHVWYIYLHLVDLYGKYRCIWHRWMIWVQVINYSSSAPATWFIFFLSVSKVLYVIRSACNCLTPRVA